MQSLVSILIPAYNSEEWISDTLRSVIAQTWRRKEIIVVNDGSTDQTLAIARQFESDCVCVVTQENQGAAAARNKAFSISQGDYIQWLDSDDLLAPDKIGRQMAALTGCRSPRTLLSSAWARLMYRNNRATFVPTALWCDLSPVEWLLRKTDQNLFMPLMTWLVSRELSEAAGPWDSTMSVDDDGEYFCRVLLASDGIRFVREARSYYRATGPTLSHIGQSDRKLESQWRSIRLQIGYLRSLEDSQRTRAASVKLLQAGLIYFYPERPDIVKQAEQMATDLGGQLRPPRLSWKYTWIVALFGWTLAKRAWLFLPRIKWSSRGLWDKALSRIHNASLREASQGTRGPRRGERCGPISRPSRDFLDEEFVR